MELEPLTYMTLNMWKTLSVWIVIYTQLSVVVRGDDCVRREGLGLPGNYCLNPGQSTNFSCMARNENLEWKLRVPPKKQSLVIGLSHGVNASDLFIEQDMHKISFQPKSENQVIYTLTIGPISESMDHRRYYCSYKTLSSCAEIQVANINAASINANWSCVTEDDKWIIDADVSDYSAVPGIDLQLNRSDNIFLPEQVDSGCEQQVNTSVKWVIPMTDEDIDVTIFTLRYRHQSTGDAWIILENNLACEKPDDSNGSGTSALWWILIAIAIIIVLIVCIGCLIYKGYLPRPFSKNTESTTSHSPPEEERLRKAEPV